MAEDLALDTKSQAATPEKDLRRWLLEIKLSEKREKEWRKTGQKILDLYRGKNRKKNSFNILWSNTEVMRPALYNSQPKPDVRRRFRQKDVLGKAVAEVCERSLSYCVDAYDLDACLKNDVLDALLPGRGQSRVRYIAKIKGAPAFEGTHEQVEYEQALCDHVQWDDFLHGPGKSWAEVTWVGFRHRLTKDDLIEKFGKEIANQIELDDVNEDDVNNGKQHSDLKDSFKRARLWEIWDKDGQKVFFVSESYRKAVIYALALPDGEAPLKFKNFFPCPEPLKMVEDTGSLIPIPLFEEYREQAEELDRVSTRINKIVNACRVRFAHDPSLTELKALMDADDNVGIPVEQARAWMANGGLDKAIWWMPIDQVAAVLKELYVARDNAKQVIYEITGISDILRGATDPNETLGAQQLKANSSSMRLQRMQREVQRYVRDLIRLLAEVIGEHFSVETLGKMTGLNFPTAIQKQQAQLLAQQFQGQQIPQEFQQKAQQVQQMLQMPSWEEIKAVLANDMQREYRVDVETDSTVAESLTKDMEGMREVLTSVVEFWQGAGPAVQAGAVTMDAIKAMTLSIVRRARMGLEVEDALESGMQEPKPQNDQKAAAEAAKAQAEQMKAQHDAKLAEQEQAMAQQQQAHEQQLAQAEEQRQQAVEFAKHQREQEALAAEARLEQQRMDYEARLEAAKIDREDQFNRWKVEQDNNTKIDVANIGADAKEASAMHAAEAKPDEPGAKPKRKGAIDRLGEMHSESLKVSQKSMETLAQIMQELIKHLSADRVLVRGKDGRAEKSVSRALNG